METDMRVAEQAAEWLVRLEEDSSAQCRTEFFEWLKQSAWHAREFLLATEAWRGLDGMDPARSVDVRGLIAQSRSNVVALEAEASVEAPNANLAKPHRRWLLAASVTAAAIAASWVWWNSGAPHTYETGIGEQRSFQLSDGSVLHLNARTRVEVAYSKEMRRLTLVEGEALFVVGHDATRPFRVSAGAATIQALGTQFNVYRHGEGATVSVLDGSVRVSSDTQPLVLGPGQEASVGQNGHASRRARADLPKAVAWRQRQLVFRDDPLSEVADQFNRYNRAQIEVEGKAARKKQLIGVFDADDPQSLLLFLEKDQGLTVERVKGRIVIKGVTQ